MTHNPLGAVRATALVVLILVAITGPCLADDLQDVEWVADQYLEAGRTGDQVLFESVLHPSCRLQFVREGNYSEWSGADYISWQEPMIRLDRESSVLHVDVAGTAALAKVQIRDGNRVFVDYLTMLEIDGRWWIVNKVFFKDSAPAGRE